MGEGLKTGLVLVLLAVCHAAESKWIPVAPVISGPLCTSQFTLVNHACAFLPFTPTPHHPSPPSQPRSSGGGGRRRRRRHRQQQEGGHGGHSSSRGGRGRRSREGRNRRQGRRRHHHESAVQQDCCRWLKEVDDECVCDLLVHLPPFLSRPLHQYTVMVDDTCSVTFQCGSRLKM